MRLQKGAEVYSSAGKKLGNLSRVILDPNTREVTHLVIEKGILFTSNKIISIDQVNPENEEMILLTTPEQDLENFQDFEEAHYVNLDSTDYPGSDVASSFWYPPADYAWWQTGPQPGIAPLPVYALQTTQNIPDGAVALEEGARVISADDREVGHIEQLIVENQDNRVTHFVVSAGLLFKERKLIPALWISTIGEKKVRLAVDAGTLERLPGYSKSA